jgi:trk/ktr system potassium uptake protein
LANQLGSPQTFCFVSRDDFLRKPGQREGLELFGINRVIWPEAQLADDIERVVAIPGAIDAEEFAGGAVRLLEYRLDSGSPLVGRPLASLQLPYGSLIVAVRRGDTFFIPRGDTLLTMGDKVVVMGTADEMAEVQRQILPGENRGHQLVTIIGGGDVGLRLAERLDRLRSVDLRVIEREAARGEMLAARLRRALVLKGDGTDLALLETEDIGRSDVLVSVIDNDEKNLLASLLGRQLVCAESSRGSATRTTGACSNGSASTSRFPPGALPSHPCFTRSKEDRPACSRFSKKAKAASWNSKSSRRFTARP